MTTLTLTAKIVALTIEHMAEQANISAIDMVAMIADRTSNAHKRFNDLLAVAAVEVA